MKRIVVLVGDRGDAGQQFVNKMNRYSADQYVLKKYSDVAFIIKNGVTKALFLDDNTEVSDSNLVYLRGISYEPVRHALAAYLADKKVPLVNSASSQFQAMSKLEQYVVLSVARVPVPDSVFVCKTEYYEHAIQLLGASYPIVAKSIRGSNGNDNMLVNEVTDLTAVQMPQPIFQAFMPNQFDYRVIVAGDAVVLAYKRIRDMNSTDYKNNITKGGARELTELSTELQDMAVRAAHAVGREFAGLDILTDTDTNRSVVLEVNFNFGTPVFDEDIEQVYYAQLERYMQKLMN